jgi:hypothetical protein
MLESKTNLKKTRPASRLTKIFKSNYVAQPSLSLDRLNYSSSFFQPRQAELHCTTAY